MSTSPDTSISLPKVTNEQFYSIIDRLKTQGALPKDAFPTSLPFFNFNTVTKESQIRELFQDSCDPNFYKSLLKNIVSMPENSDSSTITSKRLSVMQVMSFSQICLYKVLPCLDADCPNKPREIATHNQYKDYEYQCPFYHHGRDMRRIVITSQIGEEFVYKANYFEDGKRNFEKLKYSQNYFESMFHPLYYKMFRCKREYCNFSQLCPFYHTEEEKKTWDRTFSNYIRKDRISYVKDKKKYYEKDDNRRRGRAAHGTKSEQKPKNHIKSKESPPSFDKDSDKSDSDKFNQFSKMMISPHKKRVDSSPSDEYSNAGSILRAH